MVWGAVLGALGAVAGGVMDHNDRRRAERQNEALLSEIRGLASGAISTQESYLARAMPHLTGAIETIRQSTQGALAANSQAGTTAYRLANEQFGADAGAIQERMTSRGLGSSTAHQGAYSQAAGRMGIGLGQIGESIGRTNASILQSGGNAQASMQNNLAQSILGTGRGIASTQMQLGGYLSGTQYDAVGGQSAGLGALGANLGLLVDSFANSSKKSTGGQGAAHYNSQARRH